MQSAQLALDLARRCVVEGRQQKVVVFMHDMERPLEQRIADELFFKEPRMFFLGSMEGELGERLSAWEYSKNVRQSIPQWAQAGAGLVVSRQALVKGGRMRSWALVSSLSYVVKQQSC
jgi:hypothetical protein